MHFIVSGFIILCYVFSINGMENAFEFLELDLNNNFNDEIFTDLAIIFDPSYQQDDINNNMTPISSSNPIITAQKEQMVKPYNHNCAVNIFKDLKKSDIKFNKLINYHYLYTTINSLLDYLEKKNLFDTKDKVSITRIKRGIKKFPCACLFYSIADKAPYIVQMVNWHWELRKTCQNKEIFNNVSVILNEKIAGHSSLIKKYYFNNRDINQ